ncbi:MAG TPA: DUF4097 family beta strand repeat-containing protein [Thermoanaerobaculia bacterium]|nr:DUF4097 family beta strand repeat-containing protein [Thermoanaerobaculia bacterium]
MKKLTFLAALLLAAVTSFGATLTENIDKTYDVRPGAEVKLTNVNGSITVTAWDQPRVRVIAEKKIKGDREVAAEAMKELKVEITPLNGGLVIKTNHPEEDGFTSLFDWLSGDDVDAQVRYELTVPRTMNLDLSDTNGSIRVSDVTGRLELGTTNGKIETIRCAGSLDASTTNGGISAELTSVTRGGSVDASTTNGRITIAVPRNFAGSVDAATTNGAIDTDLPVATTRVGDNSLRGTINGGGTPMKLRTTNGAIQIRTVD